MFHDVYVFHLFLSLDALSLHLLLLFIVNAAALAFLLQCFDLLFVLIPLLDPVKTRQYGQRMASA